MTAQTLSRSPGAEGLQPLDVTRHLSGVARLIELCFAFHMDSEALAYMREIEWLGRLGSGLNVLRWLGLAPKIWDQGYVWVEGGQVVGSVSTRPAPIPGRIWLVANVAVHPEHRRRGIAQALMQATLDFVRSQEAVEVRLQVDDDNTAAIRLYQGLGFKTETTRTTWSRPGGEPLPAEAPAPAAIRRRAGADWADQFALATTLRPQGLGWNHPADPDDFRPRWRRRMAHFLDGIREEHWVAAEGSRIVGSLTVRARPSDSDRLLLLVHPDFQGRLERPLLATGLRWLGKRPGTLRLEHPAEDAPAAAVLTDLAFTSTRILSWMKLEIR